MKKKIPKISVIIPAYYSYDTLTDCLNRLKFQTFLDFEVIVVNSSQEEYTRKIVEEFSSQIKFIQSPVRLFPHHARNAGIKIARGELFAFTDPDCILKHDWLENIWKVYQSGHNVIVGAMGVQANTRLEMGIHICKFFPYLPGLPPGSKWIAPTANAAYARAVLEATGPFLEKSFAGDAVQSWKAAEMGFPVWFEPKARVDHIHNHPYAAFTRERYTRGQDFARERIAYEKWPWSRILFMLLLSPCLPLLVLVRTWHCTKKAGWTNRFWMTLPYQLAGHGLWCLGETVTHVRHLFRYKMESKIPL